MAAQLAKELNFDKDIIDDLIFIGMLHDCGVSSTDVHTHLVTELDWNNSQVHSIRGFELLKATNIYKKYIICSISSYTLERFTRQFNIFRKRYIKYYLFS